MFYSILPLKGSQENSPEMENTTSTSPTARLSPSMSGRDKANLLDRKFADAKRNSRSKFAATKHQESSPQPSTAPSGNDPVKLQRIYSILNAKRSTPSKAPQPQEQRSSSGENGLAAKSTSSQETTLGLRSGVRDASSLGLASLNSAASYRDLMIAKRNAFKQRMIQNEAAMRSAAEDSAETTIEAQPPKPDSQPPVKSLLDHAPVQETPVPDTPRETRQARAAVEKQTVKSARKRSSPSKSPSPEKTPSKVTKTVPASEAHTPSNSRPSSAPSSGRTRRATRGPVPRAPFQGPAIPAAAATAIKSSSFANVTRASDRTSAAVISEDLSPAEKSRKTMSDSELHAKRIEEKTKPEFSAVEPQPTIIEKETLQVDSTPQKPASNGPGLFVEDTDNDDDVPLQNDC
ncbi:hypothetical protein OGAPHI_003854 [Ogataea philodendri]|uniref:Uncharacterized protein n=1 Tax=Ogataea philodendri TaxID=1378263 RepID=A0A9P8P5X9_9ASCO|nr:uncharacterized protein OGAPHI_003854 [Ogataea philodendri]KAH3665666.1 hypothetical protein OGAPHI_003854 [Ogataea philodendri]